MATPARVAWTPDSSVASHTPAPTTTYAQIAQIRISRITASSASRASATASQVSARSSV